MSQVEFDYFQISGLLRVEASKRLSASECLKHPWMGGLQPPAAEVVEQKKIAKEVKPKRDLRKLFKQVRRRLDLFEF